jgi:hypothetical protein
VIYLLGSGYPRHWLKVKDVSTSFSEGERLPFGDVDPFTSLTISSIFKEETDH